MPKPKQITITSTVTRHHPQFARLVTIPLETVAPWKISDTTVIEGTINDTELGRRSLKRWDDRKCWWIDLPEPLCKRAKLETGNEVTLKIRLASEDLPDELSQVLKDRKARAKWDTLTQAQQRMLREDIYAAKSSEARTRRAKKVLSA